MKHDKAAMSILDEILAEGVVAKARRPDRSAPRLAEVVDDRHPSHVGRVRVVEEPDGPPRWVPCLQGVTARVGDRVLLQRPRGLDESVVVGVLDGFEERPRPTLPGPNLELRGDEALTVLGRRGQPLLQVREGDNGPVVRLLRRGLAVEVDGELSISAAAIELRATRGTARIEARDDVVVRGELIHLN